MANMPEFQQDSGGYL